VTKMFINTYFIWTVRRGVRPGHTQGATGLPGALSHLW
jgi:hypothetical protein